MHLLSIRSLAYCTLWVFSGNHHRVLLKTVAVFYFRKTAWLQTLVWNTETRHDEPMLVTPRLSNPLKKHMYTDLFFLWIQSGSLMLILPLMLPFCSRRGIISNTLRLSLEWYPPNLVGTLLQLPVKIFNSLIALYCIEVSISFFSFLVLGEAVRGWTPKFRPSKE